MIEKFTEDMKPKIKSIIEANIPEFYHKIKEDIELYLGRNTRVSLDKDENGDTIVFDLPFTFDESYLVLSFKYDVDVDEGE